VLPILALMMFATVDFARMFLTSLALANGAREGARQGIVYPLCIDTSGVTNLSIHNRIKSNTDGAVAWARMTPQVTYLNANSTPVTTPVVGGIVQVRVSTPFEPITPLVSPIIGNPSVSAESLMALD